LIRCTHFARTALALAAVLAAGAAGARPPSPDTRESGRGSTSHEATSHEPQHGSHDRDTHGHTRGTAPLPPLPPAPVYVRPAPPLAMLPRVSRVRVEASRDRAVVLEDVQFPRGDWESGGLDLYVAFGAPGAPIAIDAHIGGPDANAEGGESVSVERAPRRTSGAQSLLGKQQMAGVVLHVKEPQLRRLYAAGDLAVLRIRSLLMAPSPADGVRDVVVRLGAPGGVPLTVGKIEVVSLEPKPWITRVEANLCGPEAATFPLTVSLVDKGARPAPRAATIAPDMATRHPGDDLCVRWWASP